MLTAPAARRRCRRRRSHDHRMPGEVIRPTPSCRRPGRVGRVRALLPREPNAHVDVAAGGQHPQHRRGGSLRHAKMSRQLGGRQRSVALHALSNLLLDLLPPSIHSMFSSIGSPHSPASEVRSLGGHLERNNPCKGFRPRGCRRDNAAQSRSDIEARRTCARPRNRVKGSRLDGSARCDDADEVERARAHGARFLAELDVRGGVHGGHDVARVLKAEPAREREAPAAQEFSRTFPQGGHHQIFRALDGHHFSSACRWLKRACTLDGREGRVFSGRTISVFSLSRSGGAGDGKRGGGGAKPA